MKDDIDHHIAHIDDLINQINGHLTDLMNDHGVRINIAQNLRTPSVDGRAQALLRRHAEIILEKPVKS